MYKSREEWLAENRRGIAAEDELLERCYDTITANICEGEQYAWSPYRCICPGTGNFDGIWNWDSAFHSMGVSRWDTELAKEGLLGFMKFQKADGMFPDVIWNSGEVEDRFTKPPVLAAASVVIYKHCGEKDFLKKVYPQLTAAEGFWTKKRYFDGMFHYDSQDKGEKDYIKHVMFESGWDNSVRWDKTITDLWPIDLNCFAVAEYRALSFIAAELGLPEADVWAEKAQRLTALINERLWDSENRYYADTNRFTGEMSDVLSPASFMPLYINIADDEQAAAMAELAETRFCGKMPTVTYDNPGYSNDYWRGPMWLNVAYFAARGLKNYGFNAADKIRDFVIEMCSGEKGGIYENYDSVNKKGLCCDHFSWSCVFTIEFILNMDR